MKKFLLLFVNVIYDNGTTITLKWRKNAFTSIKVLVVTTIYNIYKQYFHLPIALFGKYYQNGWFSSIPQTKLPNLFCTTSALIPNTILVYKIVIAVIKMS